MDGRVCTRSLTALTTAILAVLLFAVGTRAQEPSTAAPKFPNIHLPAAARGSAAVSALSPYLPQLAAWYRKSTDELASIFLRDDALWTDTQGRLFYECEYGPPPANAPGAENAGAVLESPFPDDQTFLLTTRLAATRLSSLVSDATERRGRQ